MSISVVIPTMNEEKTIGDVIKSLQYLNPVVLEKYRIIVRTWSWFEKIRNALRVSREMNSLT